jgi:hypothetical protein
MSYRVRLDENSRPTLTETLARYDRLVARLRIALAVIVVLISGLMVAYHANATQTSEWQVVLTRGTSGTWVATVKGSSSEAALEACRLLVPNAATTRTQYTCNPPRRVFIVTPNPVTCPAAPWPRQQTCPTGSTGTWTQNATVGPAPTCAVTWSPTTAPAGACTPIPPPPPPPTGTGTTLSWTAPTHYERVCMRDEQGREFGCLGGGSIPPDALTGYLITYNTVGGARPQTIQVGNVTRHSIPGLTAGNWYFSVKAIANNAESAPSNVITRTVP